MGGILSVAMSVTWAAVHAMLQATLSQLAYGCDDMLNFLFFKAEGAMIYQLGNTPSAQQVK
jgi:hypothetical protein